MAQLRFRITDLAFDEEEEVSMVTAIARDDTYQVIKELLDRPIVALQMARGGTEHTITLPVQDALELFRLAGRTTGGDPRHEHTHEIYNSLSWVVYSLIED